MSKQSFDEKMKNLTGIESKKEVNDKDLKNFNFLKPGDNFPMELDVIKSNFSYLTIIITTTGNNIIFIPSNCKNCV